MSDAQAPAIETTPTVVTAGAVDVAAVDVDVGAVDVGAGGGAGVGVIHGAAQPTAAQPLAPPAAQLPAWRSLRNQLQSWLSALPPCPLSPMCCCVWSICLAAICLAALPQALLWLWQVGPVDSIDVQHG